MLLVFAIFFHNLKNVEEISFSRQAEVALDIFEVTDVVSYQLVVLRSDFILDLGQLTAFVLNCL